MRHWGSREQKLISFGSIDFASKHLPHVYPCLHSFFLDSWTIPSRMKLPGATSRRRSCMETGGAPRETPSFDSASGTQSGNVGARGRGVARSQNYRMRAYNSQSPSPPLSPHNCFWRMNAAGPVPGPLIPQLHSCAPTYVCI